MSLVNPYCTVEQVGAELRNPGDAIAGQLVDAINSACRWIDRWTGRDYFQHDYSSEALVLRRFDKQFIVDSYVYLPFTPIIELTSVTVAGTLWVEDTDYIVDAGNNRIVSLHGKICLSALTDKIEINGKFGYAQADESEVPTGIPADITRAAILASAAFSGHNQKEQVGLDGQKQAINDKNIPKAVFDILGKRRAFL